METKKEARKKKKQEKLYERKFMLLILKELIRNDEVLGVLCEDNDDSGDDANQIKKNNIFISEKWYFKGF
jgi:hypothetical protein